eukprot:GHUV01009741.1.p1 GENE.GHUV01009741.1~~GHUV01009741.1.p1  ORF type:complete len:279 (+),score=32.95 GHUV01009741.1:109-945(+)
MVARFMHRMPAVLIAAWLAIQLIGCRAANPCANRDAIDVRTLPQAEVQQAIQLSTSLTRRDLPLRRPTQPWPYRTISTAISMMPLATSANGVTTATVVHKPLAEVTAAMMVWWFNQNLETVTTYIGDNTTTSLYLQWHPRDHCHQITKLRGPPSGASGDTWRLQEFLIASRGFTRGDSAGFNAQSEAQININLKVKKLSRTGLTIQFQLIGAGTPLTDLSHTWSNTADGLAITSVYTIGNESLPPALNHLVNCQASRNDDPQVVAAKWQQHTVEEFGK